ncbi:hypothetical protein EON76_02020 [bacterium]|nr:MAG: hypothetical protein EON76_02020 [bacterium]
MNNSGVQRIIPIALVLVVIVIAVAALFSVGRSIFGSNEPEEVVNTGKQALLNTSLDRSVRLTVRGPIVADEQFHSYTVTASPTSRTLTTYQGYLDNQVDQVQLPNNNRSYEQFIYALDRASMMESDELDGDSNDVRGICATGRVYEYEVLQASNVIKKLWTTSCSKIKGSQKANNARLSELFQAQVPDANKTTRKVKL